MNNIKPLEAKDRIIIALDFDNTDDVIKYTELLKDYAGFFKAGLPLLTSCGFKALDVIKEHGGRVYFDGKFWDIPDTMAKTCINLMKRGIDFFNISITGGSKMLANTVNECRDYAEQNGLKPPVIMGASLLSSFGQKTLTNELGVSMDISDYVLKLSETAKKAGLSGVIAPDKDAARIKQELGDDFLVICPAVRPAWAKVYDQVRIASPAEAVQAGADYIIIGRPVTKAPDPAAAVKMIISEIDEALKTAGRAV